MQWLSHGRAIAFAFGTHCPSALGSVFTMGSCGSCLNGLARFNSQPVSKTRNEVKDWDWLTFVMSNEKVRPVPGLALVLLNTPLQEMRLRRLWSLSMWHCVADGAANYLHKFDDLIPDLIIGDFDSVKPELLSLFKAKGSSIRDLSYDQDSTDLDKALVATRSAGFKQVVVAGQFSGFGGRIDHTFGIANSLFAASLEDIAVVSDDSYLVLLRPGKHKLHGPSNAHCGLVPLGEPCERITTKGLRWDMTDAKMHFGGLVSVCNRIQPHNSGPMGQVLVETSNHVLWMCTISSLE